MAEDKFEPREIDFRQWLPWTQIFRGFWVALDPRKLLLAAFGILVMAGGWWLLGLSFLSARPTPPAWPSDYPSANYLREGVSEKEASELAWNDFKKDRNQWNLLYEAAGRTPLETDAADLAASMNASLDEYAKIKEQMDKGNREFKVGDQEVRVQPKPYGRLRIMPFFEDRGPNPYHLITGQPLDRTVDADGNVHYRPSGKGHHVPWERGQFFDWLYGQQVPVLIEPLVKLFRPVYYFLRPSAGFWNHVYFLLVMGWTVATWALFGGAIMRIAAVEVARNEKIGLGEARRFVQSRWGSYLLASFAPLAILAGIVVLLILFGVVSVIPLVGELWDGLLWGLAIVLGLLMACVLVGLAGWPMIQATLSTEGSDPWDGLSRCYSYVFEKPWYYLWYALVALVYGAVVVFFVGLMGSLTVYLSKWGVSQMPLTQTRWWDRDPSYLFVYAPTSFGWRDLLLQGSSVATTQGENLSWYNYIGAALVSIWLYLLFLMVIGFGYSYFWSASTIIYLLMRRKVDDTDLDEVYLEDEEAEESYSAPVAPPAPAPQPAASATPPLQMVEAPSLLRPAAPAATAPPPTAPVAEIKAPSSGDGDIAPGGGASS
jgi:hypothetical protein